MYTQGMETTVIDTPQRVIGYVRVSTDKQEIGPEVQIERLESEAKLKGWQLEIRRENAASAKSMANRPVLAQALADLKAGRADALAVAKLDRLSRNVADFSTMLETANRQRWALISLDLGIDTSSTTGAFTAQITAAVAEMERKRIGERTREGMAKIKATEGKHMGRASELPTETRELIHGLRQQGVSLRGIAVKLTEQGVATASGGKWYASTIKAILESATSERIG